MNPTPPTSPTLPAAPPTPNTPDVPPVTPTPPPLADAPAPYSGTTVTSQPAPAKKKHKIISKWYFWTIIVLSGLCLVGFIFASYALSQHASLQEKINQLNATLTEKDALLAKYAAQLGQKVDDSSHSGYIDNDKITTQDFIYIGEWGLRFKIPADLTNISYMLQTEITEATAETPARKTETVCVTGMPKNATHQPEYLQKGIKEVALGCLVKQPDNNLGTDTQARSVYQDGTSYYIYHRAQKIDSTQIEDREWEERATDLVQELLSQNITKF